jgi:hypothetical protein
MSNRVAGQPQLAKQPSGLKAILNRKELPEVLTIPVYETVLQIVHDNIKLYYDSFLPRSKKMLRENYQDLCEIVKAAYLFASSHLEPDGIPFIGDELAGAGGGSTP